jgi:hypothetical protein
MKLMVVGGLVGIGGGTLQVFGEGFIIPFAAGIGTRLFWIFGGSMFRNVEINELGGVV